jgi:type II secretion system protein C
MSRTSIVIVNSALFVLCCFLVASILTEALAEIATPAAAPTLARAPGPAPGPKSWDDRQIILDRNLFNVSVLGPSTAPVVDENLEATKLPLRLLGTAAAKGPKHSWAAVEDLESGTHLVVRVEDVLKNEAQVVRIERRRIVLQNGPRREELALEEAEPTRQAVRRPSRATPRRRNTPPRGRSTVNRLQRQAEEALEGEGNAAAQATATNLFSQARILPRYVEGQMVGVQVNAIKKGSLLEEIGLTNGDTITEVNGIRITSPEDSTSVLKELAQAERFSVVVNRADGSERTLTYEVED